MTDASKVSCPECGTAQSSQAPFCESCGYRIRRADTVKEGHQAISEEMLREYAARRKGAGSEAEAADAPATDVAPGRVPAGAAGRAAGRFQARTNIPGRRNGTRGPATAPERPPIEAPRSDADDAAGAPLEDRRAKSARTHMEGLGAVGGPGPAAEPDASSSEAADVDSAARATPPTPTDVGAMGGERHKNRLVLLSVVWISVTVVAVLLTYFLTDRAAEADEAAAPTADLVGQRVSVPSGPFLRGLDEQVRSFILQMCLKAEDEAEACEQDELLADEYPQKTVELGAFEVDAAEVTNGQWADCVDDGDCAAIDYKACQVWTHQGLQVALRVPKTLRADDHPVVCATRDEAAGFCQWAGGRLPSHDEWEKAARGADGPLFPWGASWESDLANWGEADVARTPIVGKIDGYAWTAPPGQYPDGASAYGAYDMAGNVAEWVAGDKLTAAARGGAWTDHPFDLRTTGRLELKSGDRRTDVGFRCAY